MGAQVRDERGFAMVTALLATIVAATLGIMVVQLSIHATNVSAHDKARTQSIHAAEAGLDVALSHFGSSGTLPCALSGTLNATPPATYSVTINYYASYPFVGTPMTCSGGYVSSALKPAGATLRSAGNVSGWQSQTVERYMEAEITMDPIRGAFNKAIFSNNTPVITSNITVYGENGNDADMISNADWNCQNSLTVYGSIYVQGSATMTNTCRTAVDLWANGSVTMSSSARIDHDAKSSTGSLTMSQSSSVGNNAVLGTTCTGCTSRVAGTVTTGNIQGPPPTTSFPPMVFDATAWTDEGWTVLSYTDCTAARDWITNAANKSTKAVIRITGGCSLTFSNNTTITRNADLAIFTDGEITTQNLTSWTSGDGAWHNLYLIVESAASCSGTDGRVTMSNQTGFTKLYFFVYSPCYSTFAQNNSTARGQIYGQVVAVSNNLTYTFHAMLVPGNGEITGYDTKFTFKREVD
jgi:hypothetical protein